VGEPSDLNPWEPEALAWLAGLTGGVIVRDERVRIERGPAVAEAFVSLHHRVHGERMPTEVEVQLRARVETAPDDESAEQGAGQGPFRSASSARRRVRGRPRLALGARFVTGGVTIVEPDRRLPPGDPRLDGVCFASDASDAEVEEVLSAASLKGRIADLLEQRCDSVSINEGGEWLFVRFRLQPLAAEEGERVRGIVQAFVALLEALPVFVGPARRRSPLSALSRAFPWLLPIAGIPLAAAGTSWRLPIDELPPVACAGVGFVLWALYMLGLWLSLRRKQRGRPASLRRPLARLGFVTFFGLLTSCMGLGLLINGCDSGALERHSVEVVSKRQHKSRRTLDVKEFRPGASGLLRVAAGDELWAGTAPGQRVVLVLGRGRLGWPWLAGVEAPPPVPTPR